ncbi:unnamed protein product [Phytomonas sp. Hart1]|nr:unnamed protein product [Phytomonas sp. Hart1]|eukprot:CCW71279.1 unnamed protein product [Phytomonas sp. isolate Hart1]
MEGLHTLANNLHKGLCVYKSKSDCLQVLQATQQLSLPWWNERCTEYVQTLENCIESVTNASFSPGIRYPIIVLEGLDGVGKTLTTQALASKLGGMEQHTPPPAWSDIRPLFRMQDNDISRAFYSGSNYIAAPSILHAAYTQFVIVDRWWCSTCAMGLANQFTTSTLPPDGDAVYEWPSDLSKPDFGFYLFVDEHIRSTRVRRRGNEDSEEQMLSKKSEMRATASEAYRRTHLLHPIEVPNFRAAVNIILAFLKEKGIHHLPVPFSDAEVAEIRPF